MNWKFWSNPRPSKPADVISYGIGFMCEKGHTQSYSEQTNISEFLGKKQICYRCGTLAVPGKYEKHTGHWWSNYAGWPVKGEWTPGGSNVYIFVSYLKEDELKISDKVINRLKEVAVRKFEAISSEQVDAYTKGLKDGETLTAQYVLNEVKEEK